ncbi:hypothetical protein WJX73_006294 [Symbiochloris irregularis]|uniref:SRPBCC domain-containing protein n=1 Tax=Symbiochloris irregularis TaxID=706552 RepID=A0AAW1NQW6_9CHLO
MGRGKIALSRITVNATPEEVYEKLADLQYWDNMQSGRTVLKGPVGVLHQGDRITYHSRYAPGPVDGLISESEKGQTLRWDDRALIGLIHGEHRWLLAKQGGRRFRLPFMGSASKTQVTLGQEVSGPLSFIIHGDSMEKHGTQWLSDLKLACEQK